MSDGITAAAKFIALLRKLSPEERDAALGVVSLAYPAPPPPRSALSQKRAAAGAKGAEGRWRKTPASDVLPMAKACFAIGKTDGNGDVCHGLGGGGGSPDLVSPPSESGSRFSVSQPLPEETGNVTDGPPAALPPREGIPFGGAATEAICEQYDLGISDTTGAPHQVPWNERRALVAGVHTHAPKDLHGRALVAWVRERAGAYARAHQGRETFERGFAPAKFVAWLNGGAAAPAKAAGGPRSITPQTNDTGVRLWAPSEAPPPHAAEAPHGKR